MNNLSNKDFFNDVSEFYDEMINFNKVLERKTKNLKKFLPHDRVLMHSIPMGQTNIITAADIGCGSGIDSIALASLGLDVSGFDSSDMMIKKAKENSKSIDKKIDFFNYIAQDIPISFNSKFNFICSLGNTVANIPPESITATIERFAELLTKNGKLLFHILNYEKIVKVNERIVNINKGESNYLVRFYDFENDFINFNILKFAIDNPKQRDLISTKVYPHSLELFLRLLEKNNFEKVEVYQDLNKTPFNRESSNDIYLFAEKKK